MNVVATGAPCGSGRWTGALYGQTRGAQRKNGCGPRASGGGRLDDALAAAGISNVATRVVSAHSGGGAALASAIEKTPDGSGLKCDRLELLDCLYGSQAQVEKWGGTANGKACGDVTYYHGTNDSNADGAVGRRKGLKATFGDRYHRVDVSTPRPVPTGVGPNGKPVPRFNADPHHTTVGQYA